MWTSLVALLSDRRIDRGRAIKGCKSGPERFSDTNGSIVIIQKPPESPPAWSFCLGLVKL